MAISLRFTRALLLLAVLVPAATLSLAAQSSIPTADAAAFVGDWNVALQGDAPSTIRVQVTDNAGNVAAVVTGIEGTDYQVRNISKTGEALVLGYDSTIQGTAIPIVITLTPDGENLRANVDLAGGMMTVPGTATKR